MTLPQPKYWPNFQGECKDCGSIPTVIVVGHPVPETNLCGSHFFSDRLMVDWNEWNNQPDTTE